MSLASFAGDASAASLARANAQQGQAGQPRLSGTTTLPPITRLDHTHGSGSSPAPRPHQSGLPADFVVSPQMLASGEIPTLPASKPLPTGARPHQSWTQQSSVTVRRSNEDTKGDVDMNPDDLRARVVYKSMGSTLDNTEPPNLDALFETGGSSVFGSAPLPSSQPKMAVPTTWFPNGANAAHKVYRILDQPGSCYMGRLVFALVMAAIIVAATSFCVATLQPYREDARMDDQGVGDGNPLLDTIEVICIAIFTAEYFLRLLCVPWVPMSDLTLDTTMKIPSNTCTLALTKCWTFVSAPLNLLDLIAFLPFYAELLLSSAVPGLGAIRVLRLARVLRVFKVSKYSTGVLLVSKVIVASSASLYLLVYFVCLCMVVFGSLVFYAECGDYDETAGGFIRPDLTGSGTQLTPFTSIPASFWWVVVTMTTVGYGDMYPTTGWGKFIGSVVVLFGLLVIALPVTVITANFARFYTVNAEEDAPNSSMQLGSKRLGMLLTGSKMPASKGSASSRFPMPPADATSPGSSEQNLVASRRPPAPAPVLATAASDQSFRVQSPQFSADSERVLVAQLLRRVDRTIAASVAVRDDIDYYVRVQEYERQFLS